MIYYCINVLTKSSALMGVDTPIFPNPVRGGSTLFSTIISCFTSTFSILLQRTWTWLYYKSFQESFSFAEHPDMKKSSQGIFQKNVCMGQTPTFWRHLKPPPSPLPCTCIYWRRSRNTRWGKKEDWLGGLFEKYWFICICMNICKEETSLTHRNQPLQNLWTTVSLP